MTIPSARESTTDNRRAQLNMALGAVLVLLASIIGEIALASSQTGLPLPRFVSLRKDKVNVRTGPGIRYPVDWVFTLQNMPVEIVAEFDTWRKIRDWEGTIGWVHQSMLSGRRWIIVREGPQQLRREAAAQAAIVAHVESRVLGRLQQCRNAWCKVEIDGIEGWIRRAAVWGVYPGEKFE